MVLGVRRAFLPGGKGTRTRWERIDRMFRLGEELPPVSLYKIGALYFVEDGNHRVSVARYHGVEWVDAEAEVTEFRAPIAEKPETRHQRSQKGLRRSHRRARDRPTPSKARSVRQNEKVRPESKGMMRVPTTTQGRSRHSSVPAWA